MFRRRFLTWMEPRKKIGNFTNHDSCGIVEDDAKVAGLFPIRHVVDVQRKTQGTSSSRLVFFWKHEILFSPQIGI